MMYPSVSSCNDKQLDQDDIDGRDAIYNCSPCSATCGDDAITCDEVCDGTRLGGESCFSQGFDSGTLACGASATPPTCESTPLLK